MYATGSLILAGTALFASQVSAQTAGSTAVTSLTKGLSESCQNTAAGLLASDFAGCANVISLVDVVSAQGSVVAPLNTYITGLCRKAACSDETLATTRTTVEAGCAEDIKKDVPLALTLDTIINNYPAIRSMLCLQAASNSSFCVTDTLTKVEKANKTDISLEQVEAVLSGGTTGLLKTLDNVPTSTYCTDCGQAIFAGAAAITSNKSEAAGSAAKSAASDKCGAAFVSGTIPSTVKDGGAANSGSEGGKDGAGSGAANSASQLLGDSNIMSLLLGATVACVAGGFSLFA